MASSRFGCRDGFTLAGRMTDRRGTLRAQAARLVQVAHDGEAAYARCRDFSDTGMKLDLTAPLALNDEVTIALSPSIVICGTVTWVHGRKCGIIFDGPVDSDALLAAIAEVRSEAGPPRRLTCFTAVILTITSRLDKPVETVRSRSSPACRLR